MVGNILKKQCQMKSYMPYIKKQARKSDEHVILADLARQDIRDKYQPPTERMGTATLPYGGDSGILQA